MRWWIFVFLVACVVIQATDLTAQEGEGLKMIPVVCLDPPRTDKLLTYGRLEARLVEAKNSWIYQLHTGPEGWLLILRNGPESACVVARGETFVLREKP